MYAEFILREVNTVKDPERQRGRIDECAMNRDSQVT